MSKMNVKVSTKAKLKFTAAFLITLFLLFSNYSGMNNTAKAATCSRAFNELTIACTPYTKKGNLPFAFMHCLAKEMNKPYYWRAGWSQYVDGTFFSPFIKNGKCIMTPLSGKEEIETGKVLQTTLHQAYSRLASDSQRASDQVDPERKKRIPSDDAYASFFIK